MNHVNRCDLHAHTTASDGTKSPTALVQLAAAEGLVGLAVTDHDTVDGIAEAMAEGDRAGIEVVPGVEISLEYKGPMVGSRSGWMHLLVYHLPLDGPLADDLREMQAWRAARNTLMIEKLCELGLEMSLDEVAAASGGGQIGRPHFARVMLDKGYVETRQEAFDRYLAKGAPAYLDKQRLSPDDAIARARAEGAVPVLAHPYSLGIGGDDLRTRVTHWRDRGLCGLEVIYPEQDREVRAFFAGLADDLGLIATGGTDYHGDNKPHIALGRGIDGNVTVPASVLDEIRARVR
jgi:predicted metal-dependent phosphoesterase TrpH